MKGAVVEQEGETKGEDEISRERRLKCQHNINSNRTNAGVRATAAHNNCHGLLENIIKLFKASKIKEYT